MNSRYRLFSLAIAAVACMWSQKPVLAAEPANIRSEAEALSLEQAVTIALERAPQTQARAAAIEAAQAESIAAGRLPDPELVMGIDNLPATGADAWSFNRDFMTMRKVGVMQAFPNQRKRAAQRERAAASVAVVQSQARQTRLEVTQGTADAWVASHAAELVLERLRLLQPEVALQAQAARTALASGRGSTLEALTAQSEISELDDRMLAAQREIQVARAELQRWVGEDARRTLAAAPIFMELPRGRETLLASLHRHASLLVFDAQRALVKSEIELARAEKRPDWSAELAYAKRGAVFSDMVSLEFRVGLPLFGGSRQDPLISARRANLVQLEAERKAQVRMHEAEVIGALAQWDAASRRIQLYETERLPLARQRSQAALTSFQSGRTELAPLLASHVAEIEVQRSYAELLRELGEAWVFLRYLDAGQESP